MAISKGKAVVKKQVRKARVTALPNLTGVYDCNDGGTYYMRQIGRVLWWFGEDDDENFSNVFRGTITQSTNTIRGVWADVPKGETNNNGRLGLRGSVENNTVVLERTFVTGGFGGSKWTRTSTSSTKVNKKLRQAMKRRKAVKK